MAKKLFGIVSVFILGLVGILVAVENEADRVSPLEQVHAQSCSVPAQVTGVEVQFPKCDGDVCDFTQARCVWSAVSGATSYSVTITQVETGSVVYNQSVDSSTQQVDVAIVQNNTYKCDVAAVNSCGTGTAGTHSLLCAADALVEETPTPIPPTATPIPTLPPTGGVSSLPGIVGAGSVLLSAAGVYLLLRR